MVSYFAAVFDSRTGIQLGVVENLASPHAAGEVMADAYVVLIGRDGHHPDNLAMSGTAVEDGVARPFTDGEQAAMVAALDQFMAEHRP